MKTHPDQLFFAFRWLAAALVLQCHVASADTSITHQQGTTVFDQVPQKVLTFDLASLDTLDAMQVPISGLPKAILPAYLEKYRDKQYANIGSLFEPDFEKVASMHADVIIVANRSSGAYDMLNKIAPTIDMSVWGDNFLSKFEQGVRDLALLFETREIAETHLARINEKLATLRSLAADTEPALVIMTNGGKLSAYGPGSRFGLIFDEFGLTPAESDVVASVHGDPVSHEFILQQNPAWLFVIDRDAAIGSGGASARATLDNELISQTDAFRNNRIIYLDTAYWYLVGNGLTAVESMIDEVLAALQP